MTLSEVKQKLWDEIKNIKLLCNQFKPIDNYVFVSISQEAKPVEFYDYTKRLCDLKLFYTFFQLVEAQGDLEEKSFNFDLSKVIGLCINEIEQIKDIEIAEFRLELLRVLFKIIYQQKMINHCQEYKSLIDCIYAPNLEIDPSLLDVSILNTANSFNLFSINQSDEANKLNHIEIKVHVMETDKPETVFSLKLPFYYTPTDIVCDIIKSKLGSLNKSNEHINDIVNKYKNSYVLNVCGCASHPVGELALAHQSFHLKSEYSRQTQKIFLRF
jgi:hypothetical protein